MGRNGDLASITDDATTQFIKKNFNFTEHTWFGGHRSSGGNWVLADGSDWLYENWNSNQPNDDGDVASYFYSQNGFFWWDEAAITKLMSFCQY